MKELYIIDRNVLSLISHYIKGSLQFNSEQEKMLVVLKSLDRFDVGFTMLCISSEGDLGEIQNNEEFTMALFKEARLLKKFFRYAKIDFEWYEKNNRIDYLYGVERNFKKYCYFHKAASNKVSQSINTKLRCNTKDEILELARVFDINLNDPVVTLFLAILYGSNVARKLLKPNKSSESSYNAVSDILFLKQYAMVKGQIKFYSLDICAGFLTLDKAILELSKSLIINAECVNDNEYYFEYIYSNSLFPDLSTHEFDNLLSELNINVSEF